MSDADRTADDTTDTLLLGGKLTLRQPRTGHRVGSDAVLLAAAVEPRGGELVIDCGSGVGGVGLAVAVRHPEARVRLVEIVPELAGLAEGNVVLNGLGGRVGVETNDLLARECDRDRRGADWLVSNPPFYRWGETRASPDPWRARAHQLPDGVGHGDWLHAMLRRGAADGRVVLLHRPEALPDLLAAAQGRLGSLRVLAIHPREGAPAMRILFGGIVGSRAPLAVRPALTMHEPDGAFTPLAAAIHLGEAGLALFRQ